MGDDVRFVDDAGGSHLQRLEDPFPEKVAVKLPRDPMHDGAEQYIAGVAVIPIAAGRELQLQLRRELDEFLLGVVLTQVEQLLTS